MVRVLFKNKQTFNIFIHLAKEAAAAMLQALTSVPQIPSHSCLSCWVVAVVLGFCCCFLFIFNLFPICFEVLGNLNELPFSRPWKSLEKEEVTIQISTEVSWKFVSCTSFSVQQTSQWFHERHSLSISWKLASIQWCWATALAHESQS